MPQTSPRRVALELFMALVTTASFASGQTSLDTRTVRSLALTEVILPATADPTGARPAIEPISSATVVTGAGGTVGKFTLGFKVGDDNYAHVTLSAPATDGRVVQELGDELLSGTKATFAFSRLIGFATGGTANTPPASRLTALNERPSPAEMPQTREDVLSAVRAGELTTRPSVVLSGSVDYGRQTFTFRETDIGPDLDPQLRESKGGTVSAGLLFGPTGLTSATYVGLGYRIARGWKAASAKSRCTPVADTNLTDCAAVVIGKPIEQKKESISIELRQNIGSIFGWTPMFAYDYQAEKGERALIEVPLYLVTDGASTQPKLTGGVALGWREGHGAYAAVFVGPKFSILRN
jgi:hypothetical protein